MELFIEFWSELAELGKEHPIFWRKGEQELLGMLLSQGFPHNEYEIYTKMREYLIWQRNLS